ncbi:hypothetical protein IP91_04052 [Pseudoduganella lurida]|uniref:Uncharacterized protein n=1 Tax=Pseudoduganella lurida TaxID=1036180 RepID=A0A562R0D5_9BURK|nr:hypothetical protein [Pseudoduganella lurida]TWI62532.1 hypothetical protein IP91_04052 [Pseudoduganella lurida]
MSEQMLHILGPSRRDEIAVIVGDGPALVSLRRAIDSALLCGAGGTVVYQSDGENYLLAVALQKDMSSVHTGYANDTVSHRSLREKTPIRAVKNFWPALSKAMRLREADAGGALASGLAPQVGAAID